MHSQTPGSAGLINIKVLGAAKWQSGSYVFVP